MSGQPPQKQKSASFACLSFLAICCIKTVVTDQLTPIKSHFNKPSGEDAQQLNKPFFFEKPDFITRDPRKYPRHPRRSTQQFFNEELKEGLQGSDPLFITPLLEAGDAEVARELSKVGFIVEGLQDSHAGYFTVNKEFGSNIFFWLFKAKVLNDQI
jgi:hypothetical protein